MIDYVVAGVALSLLVLIAIRLGDIVLALERIARAIEGKE